MRRGWINPPLLLIKRKKNKKYNKNKNFNIFLTKNIYIILKFIKITPGTKVPKIANFGTIWNFFVIKWNFLGLFGTFWDFSGLFYTPNITLSHLFFMFSRFTQSTAFNPISDTVSYIGLILSRLAGRDRFLNKLRISKKDFMNN